MEGLFHSSFISICLAVMVEEMGIPSPIPTDILIVIAGAYGGSWLRFSLWFVLISLASATGASILYAVIRRGGRPLIDRFGRYIHLGPKTLDRGEAILARSGWLGIVVGRATPGLRLPTVVACGLLRVPYRRFITGHICGTAVYILAFLLLGRVFGRHVLELLRIPRISIHLVMLLLLGIGLPLLLVWVASHAHIDREDDLPPGRHLTIGSAVLATLVGTATFAATWTAGWAIAALTHEMPPLSIIRRVLHAGPGQYGIASLIGVITSIVVGTVCLELVLPPLAHIIRSLRLQSLIVALIIFGLCLLLHLTNPPTDRLRVNIGIVLLLIGSLSYAITAVYARALALSLVPVVRSRTTTRRTEETPTTF